MNNVYNASKLLVEVAKRVECPRCNGRGGCTSDRGDPCICKGKGEVWMSTTGSGWYRVVGERLERSQLW